ncbi:hypothetical protein PLICRDRAFT_179798 [Plicaturopsis crispa FD-325 SS-3]|uniref:Unplaced genomic scaffold PLICRscaffold_19, whole genome shotgun sequence n=1 Tax=Plicaturopsis crispa FD-325 SS-3 TaxID=944288 RepID=A0A0C9T7E7_PLICR|nr:hypothetical protein PLICRDRAFT_179798 [Plicaturopsis crispa FD-325 SS-3]
MANSLLVSLSGAVQSAVSVELTICAGYATAAYGLLDAPGTHKLSSVCTRVFLPCLIVVACAPQLAWADIKELWVFIAWSFLTITAGFGIGWIGRSAFKLPGWTVTACAINTNSLPLLVLQPLQHTGALDRLAGWVPGETVDKAIDRARIYVLLYMLVQLTYAFAAGPSWVKKDKAIEPEKVFDVEQPCRPRRYLSPDGDLERVSLLADDASLLTPNYGTRRGRSPVGSFHLAPPPSLLSRAWSGTIAFFNPPLIAAVVAVVIGVVPFLHQLFLNAGSSPLYPSITTAVKNLGDLFISLQSFTLGAQLYLSRARPAEEPTPDEKPPTGPAWRATLFVLVVRFLLMPVVCIAGVYALVKSDVAWLRRDPMLWFIMILSPQGPPAILLSAIAEIVQLSADVEAQIAAFLFISYLASPLIAIVISAAIEVVDALQ